MKYANAILIGASIGLLIFVETVLESYILFEIKPTQNSIWTAALWIVAGTITGDLYKKYSSLRIKKN